MFKYTLFLILGFSTCCKGQVKTELSKVAIKSENKDVITSHGPKTFVRTITQDTKGNIWLGSFGGVFRYDGKSFTNVTGKVSSARFFSVLEDKKGNFWFASIGSGVYYYDGKSFRNFTTKDGLANDRVTNMYEDKTGNIWFCTEGGASRYDGKTFRNFTTKDGLNNNNVNWVFQDKTGKFWFGTRGYASLYNGKTFTTVTNKDGKGFKNVWCIIEDKKGNIWFNSDGLWRYDGSIFTKFSQSCGISIIEDKKGNIWTSSGQAQASTSLNSTFLNDKSVTISRYDEKSLSGDRPATTDVTEIKIGKEMLLFGSFEARDGSIWIGTSEGAYRYDGKYVIRP